MVLSCSGVSVLCVSARERQGLQCFCDLSVGDKDFLLKFTFNVLLKITPITLFTQEVLCSGLAGWPRSKVLTTETAGWSASIPPTHMEMEGEQLQKVVP